jgi:hypothetical protein
MSLTPNQIASYRWALEREGRLQRPASPNTASLASEVSNGEANNTLEALNKRRNNLYTRKANQWKANVAAGKINVAPRPTHREQAAMSRANFYKGLMNMPAPVEPVHTNVAQWKGFVERNESAKAQKQANLAAYFAAMKSKKPAKNIRHTSGRPGARKSRRSSRRRSNRTNRRNRRN